MRRTLIGVATAILVGSFIVPTASAASDHFYVISELAKPQYAGRQAGTPGFEQAVTYLDNQMHGVGMQPAFNAINYQLPYSTSTAVLTDESVSLNGRRLKLGVDYQPFSRSASQSVSLTKIYYVGNGTSTDYASSTPGLVVFHWNKADGSFGGPILDRVQIALAHSAKAIAIIADGELKVTNFEHPLNAQMVAAPVIYISPAAIAAAGISSDHSPRTITGTSVSISLAITRQQNAQANDLVGVVPGKLESHAVLWVTNIDGFGNLPDGRSFPSSQAGSAAAAMLLDIAEHYHVNQPQFTQIFAFVGSKWSDQAGVQALAKQLNWAHIDSVIDLYAMGGTGARSRINLGYTDPDFATVAHSLQSSTQLNTDLGNALSSVLATYSKRTLLLRDLDTWVDDSMTDTPTAVSGSEYATGVISLLSIGDDLMHAITPPLQITQNSPAFTAAKPDASGPILQHTETEHFSIYTDDSDQSLFTADALNTMESIYKIDDFYNYDIAIPSKVTALFISDGTVAALVCGRADLVSNPAAAGGGFANRNGPPCIYQRRNPATPEPLWFGNIAHELNHALASLQNFYTLRSDLQEWQGQSQFVRYDRSGQLPTSSRALVAALYTNDVPKLQSLISNYRNIDWSWFTQAKANPDGWLYTYYTAGSMYAFLSDQYGIHASRRAMYRNYADVTKFQNNMVADTGLTFDSFCEQWSYWMLHNGTPLTPVSAKVRASTDQNDAFDNMLLYTRNPQVASAGSVQGTTAAQSTGSESFGASVDITGNLKLDFSKTAAADIQISSIQVTQTSTAYRILFVLTSSKTRQFIAFMPPDAVLARSSISKGANTFSVQLPKADVGNASQLMLNFYVNDAERAFIPINAASLKLAPLDRGATSTITIRKHTITCLKGSKSRKVTDLKPRCPRGWKRK